MGFFDFFKRKPAPRPSWALGSPSPEEFSKLKKRERPIGVSASLPFPEQRAMLETMAKTGIHLVSTQDRVFTRLGGLPFAPKGFEWPSRDGVPMVFIGQFDFEALAAGGPDCLLPATGFLYVFYDIVKGPWGFDPADRGDWKLAYVEGVVTDFVTIMKPEDVVIEFKEKRLKSNPIQTVPDRNSAEGTALGLSDEFWKNYSDDQTNKPYGNEPHHQMMGYCDAVQTPEMDLECQLASNGINCGSPEGYQDPRVKQLETGRNEWLLLLQIDSDDDTKMMWGDCGMLYFWMRESDLRARNFDKAWMILQCH